MKQQLRMSHDNDDAQWTLSYIGEFKQLLARFPLQKKLIDKYKETFVQIHIKLVFLLSLWYFIDLYMYINKYFTHLIHTDLMRVSMRSSQLN